MTKKRELRVLRRKTRECVHTIDVSTKTDREVEKIQRGMSINISDDFTIQDWTPALDAAVAEAKR